jgi:hypothetical protein
MASQLLVTDSWIDVTVFKRPRPPISVPLPMGGQRLQPNKTDIEIHLPEILDLPHGVYQLREDGVTMECHLTSRRENVLFGVID